MALVPAVEHHLYRCTNPPCRKLIEVRAGARLQACPHCEDGLLVRIYETHPSQMAAHERAPEVR